MIQITLHWLAWIALAGVFSMALWDGLGRLFKPRGCPDCPDCEYCNAVADRPCVKHKETAE